MNKNDYLPHSIEAEQAVIGGLLLDNSAWKKINNLIEASDFYDTWHQALFTELSSLLQNDIKTDGLTFQEHLKKKGLLEKTGSEVYIFELQKNTPSTANIVSYADIVKEKSKKRQLIKMSKSIQEKALSNTDSNTITEEIITKLNNQNIKNELPTPLNQSLPSKFSKDLFNGWLSDMIETVSQTTETPKELSALNALAILSTCCQKKFIVEIEPGYKEPLNIWTIVALDSGNRKSAVLKYFTNPLLNWEEKQAKELEPIIQKSISDRKTQEEQIKMMRKEASKTNDALEFENLKSQIANKESELLEIKRRPRIWAQDITPESLGIIMAQNDEKMSILSSEGGLFEMMSGMYNKKGIPNIDIYLQSHAGDSVRVDRGSRSPLFMSNPALTIGLSPQPSVLQFLAKTKEFRGRGLLARFLYAIPQSNLGFRKLNTNPASQEIQNTYNNLICNLLNIKVQIKDDMPSPYILKFDKEAHAEWKEFAKYVEIELREDGKFEHIKDWAGKLPGVTARLAGLLHCAYYANSNPANFNIRKSTTTQAITLAAILSEHALKAFDLMGADPSQENAKKISRWIKRKNLTSFTERDCFNALRGTLKNMNILRDALKILIDFNYITQPLNDKAISKKNGRPPSPTFIVTREILEDLSC